MQRWKSFLVHLEEELGSATIEKWLIPLRVTHFDAGNLYLEAQDSFHAIWFEEHIRKKAEAFLKSTHRKFRIHLSVQAEEGKLPQRSSKKRANQDPADFSLTFDPLDPTCTFESFITGREGNLASQVLTSLCQKGREMELGDCNPLYLYGPPGSGKTHLLMAVAQALLSQGIKVLYVRCERFTEHVIGAIRAGEMRQFRKHYRGTDVLLLDDVQILAKKGATQEEFFHTFNALHVDRRQIILASDSAPGELRSVEERLVSRFEWGLVLAMEIAPRRAFEKILVQKAKAIAYPLSEKVKGYLLETFPHNPAQLLRALEALALRSHLDEKIRRGRLVDLDTAKGLLSDLIEEHQKEQATPERIIGSVASYYGITFEAILGKSQKKEHSLPRQLAMYLCRKQLALPYATIGETFGRDHSTVISSIRRVEKQVRHSSSELHAVASAISRGL